MNTNSGHVKSHGHTKLVKHVKHLHPFWLEISKYFRRHLFCWNQTNNWTFQPELSVLKTVFCYVLTLIFDKTRIVIIVLVQCFISHIGNQMYRYHISIGGVMEFESFKSLVAGTSKITDTFEGQWCQQIVEILTLWHAVY